jgi:hypothetical protein
MLDGAISYNRARYRTTDLWRNKANSNDLEFKNHLNHLALMALLHQELMGCLIVIGAR